MKRKRKIERRILTRCLKVMLSFVIAFTMIPCLTPLETGLQSYATTEVCNSNGTWGDWTTTVPASGTKSESRTEYSYSDKSTTTTKSTSSNPTKSGWILEKSVLDSSWTVGPLSAWEKTKRYSNSETATQKITVEERTVVDSTETQWNYDRWASKSNNTGNLGPWQGKWSGVQCDYHFYKGWSTKRLSATSSQQAYKNGVLTKFYLYGGNTDSWFNETSRTVTTASHKEYRYHIDTKYYTHTWYQWSNYSEYSPNVYYSSSTRRVQTRDAYRVWIPGTHTWNGGTVTKAAKYTTPGVRTYTCTSCGGTKTAIIPKLNPAPVTPARAKIVSAKVKSKKVTVKWNRIAAKTKGYQVAIKNKKTKKVKIYNVKASSKSKITKTLKLKKGTYAVMVRAYNVVNGETIYGKWSNVKVGKVK